MYLTALEWISAALGITGAIFTIYNNVLLYPFFILCNVGWIIIGLVRGMYGMVVFNVFLMAIYVVGYMMRRTNERLKIQEEDD